MITHLIFHHDDLDGYLSAYIAKEWVLRTGSMFKCVPVSYASFAETIEKELAGKTDKNEVMLLDFNPKPDEMARFMELIGDWQNRLTWIDHHVKAKAFEYSKLLIDGVRRYDVAACKLTWEWFNPTEECPAFVNACSDYDNDRFEVNSDGWIAFMATRSYWDYIVELLHFGPLMGMDASGLYNLAYTNYTAIEPQMTEIVSKGFRGQLTHNGRTYNVFFLNAPMFGTIWMGKIPQQHDIVCRFHFTGTQWQFSMYSQTVDVGEICLSLGGGGHARAAGFVCSELPSFVRLA